ncbi:MAG: zinc-dependent metalloprotease [Actinomycetota bacterium]
MTNEQARADMIDWDLAVATARRLTRPGPKVTVGDAREVVGDIRRFAEAAEAPVREFTGLDGSAGAAPVIVVDRAGWVQANADGMRDLISPLVHKLRAERPGAGLMDQVGPKLTGLETGALLAFLSGKVLGQFDPFWSDGDGRQGRLLLVAPNVVHVERELRVKPKDFRMWVCLHEETHRVQFTTVPWLRDYLKQQIAEFVDATDTDASVLLSRMREVLRTVLRREPDAGEQPRSLLDLVQSPEQRAVIDRVTAVMSLLEGHAEVVMDDVGPEVVPSVEAIRKKFQRRRTSARGLDKAARRFLGLDAKLRQYRDGATFVRAVVDDVGMAGFNRVWESPEALPSLDEITDPVAWVRRQYGEPALSR